MVMDSCIPSYLLYLPSLVSIHFHFIRVYVYVIVFADDLTEIYQQGEASNEKNLSCSHYPQTNKQRTNISFSQKISIAGIIHETTTTNERQRPKTKHESKMTMKVCVTGANGFIASHIVKQLLNEGYIVNGCVRDATNEKKVNHLKEMEDGGTSTTTGRLTLFSTGNLGENENFESSSLFDDAIRDCDAVIHHSKSFVASLKRPSNVPQTFPDKKVVKISRSWFFSTIEDH
jgi:hypothetical protein